MRARSSNRPRLGVLFSFEYCLNFKYIKKKSNTKRNTKKSKEKKNKWKNHDYWLRHFSMYYWTVEHFNNFFFFVRLLIRFDSSFVSVYHTIDTCEQLIKIGIYDANAFRIFCYARACRHMFVFTCLLSLALCVLSSSIILCKFVAAVNVSNSFSGDEVDLKFPIAFDFPMFFIVFSFTCATKQNHLRNLLCQVFSHLLV